MLGDLIHIIVTHILVTALLPAFFAPDLNSVQNSEQHDFPVDSGKLALSRRNEYASLLVNVDVGCSSYKEPRYFSVVF